MVHREESITERHKIICAISEHYILILFSVLEGLCKAHDLQWPKNSVGFFYIIVHFLSPVLTVYIHNLNNIVYMKQVFDI